MEVTGALESMEQETYVSIVDQLTGTKRTLEEIIEQMRIAASKTAANHEASRVEGGIILAQALKNPSASDNPGEDQEESGSQPPVTPQSAKNAGSQQRRQGEKGGNGNNGNRGNRI